MRDGIRNRRRGPVEWQLTNPLGAGRAARVRQFLEENANRRDVHRSRHDVIGDLAVHHAAFLPDHIFAERKTDALRDSAFDLSRRQNWIDDLADFLNGDKVFDANFGRARVHGNLRDINSPGVCAVGVALIFCVVPVKLTRMLIFHQRLQRAKLGAVLAAGLGELGRSVALIQNACIFQRFLDCQRRGLDKFSDNHSGPGSDGWTAIRHQRSIGL